MRVGFGGIGRRATGLRGRKEGLEIAGVAFSARFASARLAFGSLVFFVGFLAAVDFDAGALRVVFFAVFFAADLRVLFFAAVFLAAGFFAVFLGGGFLEEAFAEVLRVDFFAPEVLVDLEVDFLDGLLEDVVFPPAPRLEVFLAGLMAAGR